MVQLRRQFQIHPLGDIDPVLPVRGPTAVQRVQEGADPSLVLGKCFDHALVTAKLQLVAERREHLQHVLRLDPLGRWRDVRDCKGEEVSDECRVPEGDTIGDHSTPVLPR